MTREAFIEALNAKHYSYEIEGDKLVVTHNGNVTFPSLNSLPSGVEFRNSGYVWMLSLNSLPSGVEFRNGDGVYLQSLNSLPSGVEFRNGGDVSLNSLETIPSDAEFNNVGDVILNSLIGPPFHEWRGNIEGIGNEKLLNIMIKRSLFV